MHVPVPVEEGDCVRHGSRMASFQRESKVDFGLVFIPRNFSVRVVSSTSCLPGILDAVGLANEN
jgi:hypothetical protein